MAITRPCRVDRVIDGDSLEVDIDLGMGTAKIQQSIRLLGVDTHEIHFVDHDSEEYQKGMTERRFVEHWIRERESNKWPLHVTIPKEEKGKYGRWLGIIKEDKRDKWDSSLNKAILDKFNEVEY